MFSRFIKSLIEGIRGYISPKEEAKYRALLSFLARGYREGSEIKEHISLRELKKLLVLAAAWKGTLDDFEIEELQETGRYQLFCSLLLQDKKIREEFFSWALRDHNPVDAFILFPEIAALLHKKGLSSRFGFYGEKHLKVSADRQELFIRIENRWVSLKDLSRKVTFKNGFSISLEKILDSFGNKSFEVGEFEIFDEGIVLWNTLDWSSALHKIDLSKKTWYKELPLLRSLSSYEAELRYQKTLVPGDSVVAAYATRDSSSLDFRGTHAFLEMAVYQEDGSYTLYNFGKFAKKFPKNSFETFKMLCQNAQASIAYPDENIFYSEREHALYPFIIQQEGVDTLFEAIRSDFKLGEKGTFLYQIESENCAKWALEKITMVVPKKDIPDLFFLPLLETEPMGAVRVIFEGIKTMPKAWQVPLLSFFHLFLGATQTTWIMEGDSLVAKSLRDHDFFSHGCVFLPSLLVHKVVEEFGFESMVVINKLIAFFNLKNGTQLVDSQMFNYFKPPVRFVIQLEEGVLCAFLWHRFRSHVMGVNSWMTHVFARFA